ncbi:hypothetical protein COW98_01765 [Candidatus Roizmanbacteria bacterium CG22_combo_CG10-13_8_21_14_all_35_9]|uniref:Thioredoxin domain-containing protein n=4 Tax=Candidatus Roizmaniibacteriota TaxID=1752723 RepID=A0A2M8F0W2_9BACT|nr:MAG: hypothetical protein COX47_01715 [Candidatus Roizmanbacteria bacterium CG23_combo_of_CG06-09_8_20_14_all_35_49]PIP62872.1 MAG: hypothetical protein COW98_01765 [Candidatus Roizmanbacteria bacterium CG22_combo_CG10-13_8_21_14_all_35_9]PIY70907.1 MAG: hypothetical protein COY88_03235 [Candidatus Roizmanbacteria bacterium CG_4_10_14_0_8_um_filter_35_28]PJC32925.1 MAG: hypothetical protein CO048_04050 [Candidatus Roizmanbacteria bacterium CG_4_9_14_0_2_um_filter_35_15]PJC82418.1 MAG: hypoth
MPKSKKTEENAYCPPPRSNNVIYVMMGILTLFAIFLFIKVSKLEKTVSSGATGTTAAQQESPLSVKNLKKYAKELKLNTGKFNKCLDSGEKQKEVASQGSYGASLGVQGTPAFFINGKFLGGAFPLSAFKEIVDKELDGTSSTNCVDYSETNLQQQCDQTGTDTSKAFKPNLKEIKVGNAPIIGEKNAKVTIIEFSDFECPYCQRAYSTVEQIMKDYQGKVKLYYMQYPLPPSMHPNAEKAAEASLCAADQGKFWDFYHKLFQGDTTQK